MQWLEILTLEETHLINLQNVLQIEPFEDDDLNTPYGVRLTLNSNITYQLIGLKYNKLLETLKSSKDLVISITVEGLMSEINND